MKFNILTLIFEEFFSFLPLHAKYKPRESVNLRFTKILANKWFHLKTFYLILQALNLFPP